MSTEITLTLHVNGVVNLLTNEHGKTRNLTNGCTCKQTRESFLNLIADEVRNGAKIGRIYFETPAARKDIARILGV